MTITDNFIYEGANAGGNGGNDCVRITNEVGSVSNVTVNGNFLFGGKPASKRSTPERQLPERPPA